MKVCLFGGSFDPPHQGHRAMARAALEKGGQDQVVVIPAARSPLKEKGHGASPRDRLEMARLAFQGIDGVEISDEEIRRGGISWTVDTLRAWKAASPPGTELSWLLGSDSLPHLPKWKDVHRLFSLCRFLVVPRPGFPKEVLQTLEGALEPWEIQALEEGFLDVPPVPVSSTEVRRRLAEGLPLEGLVPPAVQEWIRDRGLDGAGYGPDKP